MVVNFVIIYISNLVRKFLLVVSERVDKFVDFSEDVVSYYDVYIK